MKRLILLAILNSLLGTSTASACTPIVSLPATITTPGTYCLNGDLSVANGTAITVNANFVTLDLRGYSIRGPGGVDVASSRGIYVFLRSNVIVRNGTIRGFDEGIAAIQSTNVTVEHTTISDTSTGIHFTTTAHVSARGNRIVDVNRTAIRYFAPSFPIVQTAIDQNTIVRDNEISDVGKTYASLPALGYGITSGGKSPAIIHNNAIDGLRGGTGSMAISVANASLVVENKIAGAIAGMSCGSSGSKAVRNVLANGLGISACLNYDNF